MHTSHRIAENASRRVFLCLAFLTLLSTSVASLVEVQVEEVPDITAELEAHGVMVENIDPLSNTFQEINQRYQEAPKGTTKLWLLASSSLTDEKKSTNVDEARRQTARLIPALAELVKDPLNEIWILSGHPLSKLLGFYPGVPAEVNFAAEWGAHVREGGTESLAPAYDLNLLEKLIEQALQAHEGKVFIKENLPEYKRMTVLKYDSTKSNVDDVQAMLDQLDRKIQRAFEGKIITNHNRGGSYFYFQYRGENKGTFAMKLLVTRKPGYVISLGDSAKDESMHQLMKNSNLISDTVIKSSEANQKTFAQHKVEDVPGAQEFIVRMASAES